MHRIQCIVLWSIEYIDKSSMHIKQYIDYNVQNTTQRIQCLEYNVKIQCIEYHASSTMHRIQCIEYSALIFQ